MPTIIEVPHKLKDLGFKTNHIKRITGKNQKESAAVIAYLESQIETLTNILASPDIDANFISMLSTECKKGFSDLQSVIETLSKEEYVQKISAIKSYYNLETISLGSIMRRCKSKTSEFLTFLTDEDTVAQIIKIHTKLDLKLNDFLLLFRAGWGNLMLFLDFLAQDDTLEAIKNFLQDTSLTTDNFSSILHSACSEENIKKLLESKSMFQKLKSEVGLNGNNIISILCEQHSAFVDNLSILSRDENIQKLRKFILSTQSDASTLASHLSLSRKNLQKNIDIISCDEFIIFYNRIKEIGFQQSLMKSIFAPWKKELEVKYEELKKIIPAFELASQNPNINLSLGEWANIIKNSYDEVDFWNNLSEKTGVFPWDDEGNKDDESLSESEIIDFINNFIAYEGLSIEEKLPLYNWVNLEIAQEVEKMINVVVSKATKYGIKDKYLRKMLESKNSAEAYVKLSNLYIVMDDNESNITIFDIMIAYENLGIKLKDFTDFLCDGEESLLDNLSKLIDLITPNAEGISPLSRILNEHEIDSIKDFAKVSTLPQFYKVIMERSQDSTKLCAMQTELDDENLSPNIVTTGNPMDLGPDEA